MIEEKISAIVITEAEEMIGIVTHEDLLKVLASILMKTEPEHRKKFELVNTSPLHKVSEFLEGWNLDSYLV